MAAGVRLKMLNIFGILIIHIETTRVWRFFSVLHEMTFTLKKLIVYYFKYLPTNKLLIYIIFVEAQTVNIIFCTN